MAGFDEDAAIQRVAQSVAAMTAGRVVKLIEEAEQRGAENALRAAAAEWYADDGPRHPLSAKTWLTRRADKIGNRSSDREYRRMMAAAMTDDLEGDGFGLDQWTTHCPQCGAIPGEDCRDPEPLRD